MTIKTFFDVNTGIVKYYDDNLSANYENKVCSGKIIIGGDPDGDIEKMKIEYLNRNLYRFSTFQEVVEGVNTIWSGIPENATEEGNYFLTNHLNSNKEGFKNLTALNNRIEELKNDFLRGIQMQTIEVIPVRVRPSLQPQSTGTQTI